MSIRMVNRVLLFEGGRGEERLFEISEVLVRE
jgi:hypothetical protein